MLWDCETGDCQGISDGLEFCPVCGTPRPDRNPPGLPDPEPEERAEPGEEAATAPDAAGLPPDPPEAVESSPRDPGKGGGPAWPESTRTESATTTSTGRSASKT